MNFVEDALLTQLRAGLLRITINRPPLNILDLETLRGLTAALRRAREDRQTRLVVLTSAGERAFCAGVDIRDHLPGKDAEMIEAVQDNYGAFAELAAASIPTVALVKGLALGGGCELAALCDTLIARDDAEFGLPEIKLGVFPPLAAALFHRRLTPRVALRLMLTGERISAAEALRVGLAHQVLPANRFHDDAEELLLMLAMLGKTGKEKPAGG
jgi:enoyl-CoA hydratase/carnithine racemase